MIAIAASEMHSLAPVSPNTVPDAIPGGPYLGAVNTSIRFDGSLSSSPACSLAVVYDPSAGAYTADPTQVGKATFGFVSRHQKGASIMTGNNAFEFDLTGLAFSSTSYEWLVVNQAGTNAQFKGSGLINGALDPNGNGYKFMLWAGDGSDADGSDTFRIRIWWEDDAGLEHDVYDNGTDQVIGGGSIVVHTRK